MYIYDFLNCILSYVCSERVCLHCAQVDAMEGEMRRERSQRDAFEKKIADLEKMNDQLQQVCFCKG